MRADDLYLNFDEFCSVFDKAAGNMPIELKATPQAILYLAWAGVRLEDAPEILKIDVATGAIHDRQQERFIHTEPKIISFLQEYAQMPMCADAYKDGKYLLRTLQNGSCDTHHISQQISRFKRKLGADEASGLTYLVVYRSGLFDRVYKYEQTHSLPYRTRGRQMVHGSKEIYDSVFETHFENRRQLSDYLNTYNRYKERRDST